MKPNFSFFAAGLILFLSVVKSSLPVEATEAEKDSGCFGKDDCLQGEVILESCDKDDCVDSTPRREISYSYFGTAPIIQNPSAPRNFLYKGQWINLARNYKNKYIPNFEPQDTFFIQSIYHSKNLFKRLEKYHELNPHEDTEKLLDIFYQMDYSRPSGHFKEIPSLDVSLPLSVRTDDFLKRIASIDQDGNPASLDNFIFDVSKDWQLSSSRYSILEIINARRDPSKPLPNDIFVIVKLSDRKFSAEEYFQFQIGNQSYRLKTMANTFMYRLAIQGDSNRPNMCVFDGYSVSFGKNADYLLNEVGWTMFHYQRIH